MSKLSTRSVNLEVGKRLQAVREASDLTQEAFSSRLGVTLRAYGSYERGDREIPTALFRTLVEENAVDPVWLLTGPGDQPVYLAERRVNGDLLAAIIEMIEEWLNKNRRSLKPDKKALVIRMAYEHCTQASRIDRAHLAQMLSLAA